MFMRRDNTDMRTYLLTLIITIVFTSIVSAQEAQVGGLYVDLFGSLLPGIEESIALTGQVGIGYQFDESTGLGLGGFIAKRIRPSTTVDLFGLGAQYRWLSPNRHWLAKAEAGLIALYHYGTDLTVQHFYLNGFDTYGKIYLGIRPKRRFTVMLAYTYVPRLHEGFLEYDDNQEAYVDLGWRQHVSYHFVHLLFGYAFDPFPPARRQRPR